MKSTRRPGFGRCRKSPIGQPIWNFSCSAELNCHQQRRISSSLRDRGGAAIVFALIALLVASMMLASMIRSASVSHYQLRRNEFRVQAGLLADAGRDRVLWLLKNQADFHGEVWKVPANQLGSGQSAEVRLSVEGNPANASERIVKITAEYPVGHPDLVRVSRQLTLR